MILFLAGWFLVAVFVGEIELLTFVPVAVPVIVLGLTTLLLLVFSLFRPFREWLLKLDLRYIIGLHLVRFVGIYFLVLHARGQLPAEFAVPAGWGDIIVALGALALLVIPNTAKARFPVLAWSIVGLLDILYVVKTAAGLIITNPESLSVMTRLPLSLLPTMIVPLVIFTHVVFLARLVRKPEMVQNPERSEPVASYKPV